MCKYKYLVTGKDSVFDFGTDARIKIDNNDVSTSSSLITYNEQVCEIVNIKGKDGSRNIFDIYFTAPKGTSSCFCELMYTEMVSEFLKQNQLFDVVELASKFAKFENWVNFIQTDSKICYEKDTAKLYVFSEGRGSWFDVSEKESD